MMEIWKPIQFNAEGINIQIEVSNLGRVRRFNSNNEFVYLKGSMVSGYPCIRLRVFKERNPADQIKIDEFRSEISTIYNEVINIKKLIRVNKNNESVTLELKKNLEERSIELEQLKKKYQKFFKNVERKRSINFGGLIHRHVAELFLDKPSESHDLVAHLNYNKLDNRVINLKWMTREENTIHQQKSPYVIDTRRKNALKKPHEKAKHGKLSVSNVMIIKKRISQGVPLNRIAKKFNISEMQVSRIKRGENWAEVPAAL